MLCLKDFQIPHVWFAVGKGLSLLSAGKMSTARAAPLSPNVTSRQHSSVMRGPTGLVTPCPTITILPRLLPGVWRSEAAQGDELSPYRIHMCHCAGSTCHCLGDQEGGGEQGGSCPAAPGFPQSDFPCPSRLFFLQPWVSGTGVGIGGLEADPGISYVALSLGASLLFQQHPLGQNHHSQDFSGYSPSLVFYISC